MTRSVTHTLWSRSYLMPPDNRTCKKREVLRAFNKTKKKQEKKESDFGLLMGGQLMHIGMF